MEFKVCIPEPFFNCEKIYPLQQQKVAKLLHIVEQYPEVRKILIFGSSISMRCNITSDVDIYVELDKEVKLIREYIPFEFGLWTNFTVDERLLKEINETGVTVYERNHD